MSPETEKALLQAATQARKSAYCPYSSYAVGAAVLDEHGVIHPGCNVENVSFPASICAERVAVGRLVSSGSKSALAVCVVTEDGGTPCGICLQTLAEFAGDPAATPIITVTGAGSARHFMLNELLPHGFRSDLVR